MRKSMIVDDIVCEHTDDSTTVPFIGGDGGMENGETLTAKCRGKKHRPFVEWFRKIEAEHFLLALMVLGVVCGIALGVVLRIYDRQMTVVDTSLLNFPGEIFLRMLNMLIVPLIVCSLINSLAELQTAAAGRIAIATSLFYALSTLVAVAEGIILTMLIRPGAHHEKDAHQSAQLEEANCETTPLLSILDLFRNMFPDNLVNIAISSTRTCAKYASENQKNHDNNNDTYPTYHPQQHLPQIVDLDVQTTEGTNCLGLVMVSIAIGVAISKMGARGRALAKLFLALEELTMKLVNAVIWTAPVGVMFLIAAQVVEMKDAFRQLRSLGLYVATVMTGLVLHNVVLLSVVFLVLLRKNPLTHAKEAIRAAFTALGTDSSSATIPVSLRCCERLGYDGRVARFVLPFGASLNLSGAALYEAVAAFYIGQLLGAEFSIGKLILTGVAASLVSIVGANIPSAGTITMVMALKAADLPPKYAALVIPVDWFMDRTRTGFTVYGDTICVAVVNFFCKNQLQKQSAQHVQLSAMQQSNLDKHKNKTNYSDEDNADSDCDKTRL